MSKRKMLKKGMAYASAAIMLAGSMPMTAVNAFAAETDVSYIAVQADNQTASGKWGTCEWTIDNGVLTIGGALVQALIPAHGLIMQEASKRLLLRIRLNLSIMDNHLRIYLMACLKWSQLKAYPI